MQLKPTCLARLPFQKSNEGGPWAVGRLFQLFGTYQTGFTWAFPLSAETPITKDKRTAAIFFRDTPPADTSRFWEDHLSRLETLVGPCAPGQQEWGKRIRPEIAPSAGRFSTVSIDQMFLHFCLRGKKRIWQCANGFPTTGSVSQEHLLPVSKKDVTRARRAEMYETAAERFRERARHCGAKDAQSLWDEAPAQ